LPPGTGRQLPEAAVDLVDPRGQPAPQQQTRSSAQCRSSAITMVGPAAQSRSTSASISRPRRGWIHGHPYRRSLRAAGGRSARGTVGRTAADTPKRRPSGERVGLGQLVAAGRKIAQSWPAATSSSISTLLPMPGSPRSRQAHRTGANRIDQIDQPLAFCGSTDEPVHDPLAEPGAGRGHHPGGHSWNLSGAKPSRSSMANRPERLCRRKFPPRGPSCAAQPASPVPRRTTVWIRSPSCSDAQPRHRHLDGVIVHAGPVRVARRISAQDSTRPGWGQRRSTRWTPCTGISSPSSTPHCPRISRDRRRRPPVWRAAARWPRPTRRAPPGTAGPVPAPGRRGPARCRAPTGRAHRRYLVGQRVDSSSGGGRRRPGRAGSRRLRVDERDRVDLAAGDWSPRRGSRSAWAGGAHWKVVTSMTSAPIARSACTAQRRTGLSLCTTTRRPDIGWASR